MKMRLFSHSLKSKIIFFVIALSLTGIVTSFFFIQRPNLLLFIQGILFVIIAGVSIHFVLQITRDLSTLSKAIKAVELGHGTIQTNINRQDEICQLALAFNSMSSKLQTTTVSKNQLTDILGSLKELLIVLDSSEMI